MRFFFKWKKASFSRGATGLEKQRDPQAHTLLQEPSVCQVCSHCWSQGIITVSTHLQACMYCTREEMLVPDGVSSRFRKQVNATMEMYGERN